MRKLLRSKRVRVALAIGALAAIGVAIGGYVYEKGRTGNVYHPHARFVAQTQPTLPRKSPEPFAWPFYGYSLNHTRFYPAPASVRPPYRQLWDHHVHPLLEFPPVIYGQAIYQLADDGTAYALEKRTGRLLWEKSLGQLSASTPGATSNTLYLTLLESGNANLPGRIVALNSANGEIRWSRDLPAPSESSPIIWQERVYFGSQDGTVYCLNDRTGATIWTYQASGAVKASPTLENGVLYFGDYGGHVQAVSARTGRALWDIASEGALLGSGTFYSTAAAMYGRIFLGNTDGHVYAYDQRTGALDWAVQTGAYVYASPAVSDAPGIGPTVYVGSYNGTFYAFNARTGAITWQFTPGGRISGSATIIGNVVYFADLGRFRTYGLNISTGKVEFESGDGAFDPAISDGHDLYLTGYSTLYAMEPIAPAPAPTARASVRASGAKKQTKA